MFARLKRWARAIKTDVLAVHLAARDPRVPWYAKLAALCVAAYALSPIDLIPDFIPVIGYIDELVILPVGVLLVSKLIPPQILAEHRITDATGVPPPRSIVAAIVIVLIWLAAMFGAGWFAYRYLAQ